MPDWSQDQRRYVIQSNNGEYFVRYESTKWETVKTSEIWSKDINEAYVFRLKELQEHGSNYPELCTKYTALKLIEVEDERILDNAT